MAGSRKNTAPATESSTGFWNVELASKAIVAEFVYLPGQQHVVDDATLAEMRNQGAVENATEAR